MNKTYYRGDITLLSQNPYYIFSKVTHLLGQYEKGFREISSICIEKKYKAILNMDELCKIHDILDKLNELQKMDITGIFPSLSKMIYNNIDFCYTVKKNIIFELILDENGEYYGRELYTGLIFPILKKTNSNNIVIKENIFYEQIGNKFIYDIYYIANVNFRYLKMDKCEALVHNVEVADINEVNNYLKVKSNKRKFKKEINEITNIANKNVFNSEIVEVSPKEIKREKQDELTIMMENIEFLLEKLGTINSELRTKYEKEYVMMLDGEDDVLTMHPITKASLSALEGKIEFAILYSRTSYSDIVGYLDSLKKEYLHNFVTNSGEKTSITLKELDKLNELFLKMKSSYNLKIQREVLRNISFIYLMEV